MKIKKHIPLLILLAPFLLLALPLIPKATLLACGDGGLGSLTFVHRMFTTYGGGWMTNYLLGQPSPTPLRPGSLILSLFTPELAEGVIYVFLAFLAATGTFLFLRQKKLSAPAAFLGGLSFGMGGDFFTLINAGHLGKFELMACFAWAMFFLEKALQTRKTVWFATCGALFAWGISAQPDVGLLMAIIPAGYTLLHWFQIPDWKAKQTVLLKLLIAAIAFAIIILPAFSGTITNLISKKPAAEEQPVAEASQMTPAEKWNWATSWSLPADEVFEFICPGFFGFNSGNPDAPYWGRVGPANAPRTQNFRQNGEYLGLIPFAFFLAAMGLALRKGALENKPRREIFFWSGTILICLLFALGRFAPFYGMFFKIPYMDQMRVPIKFLHPLAFAFAVMSAFGLDALLRDRQAKTARNVMWILIGLTASGLAGTGIVALQETSITTWFSQLQFPQSMIGNIHANMIHALLRMSLLSALSGGFFFAYSQKNFFSKHWKKLTLILLTIFVIDMVNFSKRYIHTAPYNQLYHKARIVSFLEKNRTNGRTKFLSRQNIYNHWLTYHMTYFDLQSIDVPAMRNMPNDYGNFFQALEKNPLRLFQLTSTRYFMGSAQIWQQLTQLAPTEFKSIERYRIALLPDQSIETLSAPNGSEVLGMLTSALPRCGLYSHWKTANDTVALQQLGAASFDLSTSVLVPESFTTIPAANPAPVQKVEITSYKANRVEISLPEISRPGIIVLTDRFDPAWKATVDGKPVDILRCNYIMRGIAVHPGDHTVIMTYTPFRTQFIISAAGLILVLLWAAAESILARKK
jgi:hypothetical protein